MTRVLVSGASGFLGLPLLAELARGEREVHALCTRAARPAPVSAAALGAVRWHQLDLRDHVALDELVGELRPEQLVHLAWITAHGRYWQAAENLDWVAHSLCLLRAFARRGGRRLVVAGTCAEYDWSHAAAPLSESLSPLAPATLYGAAKDALRRVAEAYARQEGIELAWGRLFFLYGPREAPARLVPSVARSLLRGEAVATGSDQRVRDFMHVQDAASAIAALLDSDVVGAVNIASGIATTVGGLLDALAAATGRGELLRRGALPDRPGEPAVLLADVARLRDEVGFRARWELADGIAETVRWWAEREALAAAPSAA